MYKLGYITLKGYKEELAMKDEAYDRLADRLSLAGKRLSELENSSTSKKSSTKKRKTTKKTK